MKLKLFIIVILVLGMIVMIGVIVVGNEVFVVEKDKLLVI